MILPKPPSDEHVLVLFVLGLAMVPGKEWTWTKKGEINLKITPKKYLNLTSPEQLSPILLTQGATMSPTCKTFMLKDGDWEPCKVPKEGDN